MDQYDRGIMLAGNVSVDNSGSETYTPDSSANAAKSLYLLLIANQSANTTPQTTLTPPVVIIDPITFAMTVTPATSTTTNVPVPISVDAKKAQANLANLLASWMVDYLHTNASIFGTVDTTTGSTTQPINNGIIV